MAKPRNVLIVDQDQAVSKQISDQLSAQGITVAQAKDYASAVYLFNQRFFDTAIVEQKFSDLPGLAIIQKWRQHENEEKRTTGFLLAVSHTIKVGETNLTKELGEIGIIEKPLTIAKLLSRLSTAYEAKLKADGVVELRKNILDYHLERGDYEKAIEAIKAELPALGAKGLEMLWHVLGESGDYAQALNYIEPILKQDPDHLTALNAKAAMLMKLGKAEAAKECYEKLDEMAPFNLDRIQKMGEMYLQTSDPINAKSKFKELIDLCPEEPDLKFDKIAAFFRVGFKEAGAEFATETSTPAEVVRYYNNRGVVLIQRGEIEEALLEYRRALALFPKHSQNYKIIFNMALAHLKMRPPQPQKAIKCLEETVKRKPNYDKASILLDKLKTNSQVGELTEENLDDKSL